MEQKKKITFPQSLLGWWLINTGFFRNFIRMASFSLLGWRPFLTCWWSLQINFRNLSTFYSQRNALISLLYQTVHWPLTFFSFNTFLSCYCCRRTRIWYIQIFCWREKRVRVLNNCSSWFCRVTWWYLQGRNCLSNIWSTTLTILIYSMEFFSRTINLQAKQN